MITLFKPNKYFGHFLSHAVTYGKNLESRIDSASNWKIPLMDESETYKSPEGKQNTIYLYILKSI